MVITDYYNGHMQPDWSNYNTVIDTNTTGENYILSLYHARSGPQSQC